tara:strand:+ start:27 stop:308 length:282 start_codon:yes stop_codon:yes gene_type:complete
MVCLIKGELKMATKNVTVIDAYYKGVNGWTYSHTMLTQRNVEMNVNFDVYSDYEDLFLSRVVADDPEPTMYLNGTETTKARITEEDMFEKEVA